MANSNKNKNSKQVAAKKVNTLPMVFKKQNYILLIVSLVVIIIGFIIMGAGKDKPFDDAMKITVAPVIVLLGFAIGVYSILHTPKAAENQEAGK